MTLRTTRRRTTRITAVVWGAFAFVCLGSVLTVWLGSPTAAHAAAFGPSGSMAVLAVALMATIIGTAVASAPQATRGLRWGTALPMAIIAGGVTVLAITSLFAPTRATDVGLGALMAAGAIGMDVVATQVGRRRLP